MKQLWLAELRDIPRFFSSPVVGTRLHALVLHGHVGGKGRPCTPRRYPSKGREEGGCPKRMS